MCSLFIYVTFSRTLMTSCTLAHRVFSLMVKSATKVRNKLQKNVRHFAWFNKRRVPIRRRAPYKRRGCRSIVRINAGNVYSRIYGTAANSQRFAASELHYFQGNDAVLDYDDFPFRLHLKNIIRYSVRLRLKDLNVCLFRGPVSRPDEQHSRNLHGGGG
jgi:hypothetical protein